MIKTPNVVCRICNKEFYRRLCDIKKWSHHYCSKECQNLGRKTGKILKCTNCGIDFYRQNKECLENRNYFCSNSCSATYNNKNKTYGFTRSKLEIYIEEQLRIKFPELNIICNSKKEIGSELDFYFPDLRFAIELNGIVHYEPIYGLSKFEQIQNNDKLKFLNCHKNGIELAVIDTSGCGHLTVKSKSKYLNIVFELIEPLLTRLSK